MKVAFQGEPGAYSEMAAIQHFGPNVELVPCKTLSDVFENVENNEVDVAVVPIENSIEGSVNETYDLLLKSSKKVMNEIFFRVVHCLISYKNNDLTRIKNVYSHPQALGQCRNFIEKHGLQPIPFYDTAGSVKMLTNQAMPDSAAIASERAAQTYEMKIIQKGIEDSKNNYTRFLVLADHDSEPTGDDKTLVILTIKHVPGALYRAIGEFASRNINLTMIVSRPTKEKPWEYNFYIDFEGHRNEQNVKECLAGLESITEMLKIAGSYPKFKHKGNGARS